MSYDSDLDGIVNGDFKKPSSPSIGSDAEEDELDKHGNLRSLIAKPKKKKAKMTPKAPPPPPSSSEDDDSSDDDDDDDSEEEPTPVRKPAKKTKNAPAPPPPAAKKSKAPVASSDDLTQIPPRPAKPFVHVKKAFASKNNGSEEFADEAMYLATKSFNKKKSKESSMILAEIEANIEKMTEAERERLKNLYIEAKELFTTTFKQWTLEVNEWKEKWGTQHAAKQAGEAAKKKSSTALAKMPTGLGKKDKVVIKEADALMAQIIAEQMELAKLHIMEAWSQSKNILTKTN